MRKSIPNEYFEKIQSGTVTGEDSARLKQWLAGATEKEIAYVVELFGSHFEQLEDTFSEDTQLINAIEQHLDEADSKRSPEFRSPVARRVILLRVAAMAAVITVFVSIGLLFTRTHKQEMVAKTNTTNRKINPGTNKATLTLANGSTIVLDSVNNGVLASLNHVRVLKSRSGQLIYDTTAATGSKAEKLSYNMINVPRGGQYEVVLPDGTHVWINSASSLRYPTRFEGTERQVQLTGEAYFEVAKDKAHPFRVGVNDMEVQVLGTHFNIMGYKDEGVTRTTLLEGAVKVIKGSTQQTIHPGQQAIVREDIRIADVDVDEAIEWKNGNFNFSHEKLEVIMRKISRWYNVDIDYEGKTSTATFVGTLPRSSDIGEVLKYLELTGLVHFKVTERRVTAMP
jgi:ferric-dicitrate binding protein FerR (iron transport regulator)